MVLVECTVIIDSAFDIPVAVPAVIFGIIEWSDTSVRHIDNGFIIIRVGLRFGRVIHK